MKTVNKWSRFFSLLPKLDIVRQLNCFTFGVSNNLRKVNRYVFFYESDGDNNPKLTAKFISSVTGLTLVIIRTKHGFHYVGFNLLTEREYLAFYETLHKHIPDYYDDAKRRDFILRIAPKFRLEENGTITKISEAPKYLTYVMGYRNNFVSVNHLRLYATLFGLPKSLCKYLLFRTGIMRYTEKLRFTFYKTRD